MVILRFLAAFITFFATNRVIGFNPYLDHTYTELVFAAVSVVFPTQILLFFEAVFIILHILYVSHYLAFVTAIFFAILYFVYVRFIPKDGYVIFVNAGTFFLGHHTYFRYCLVLLQIR